MKLCIAIMLMGCTGCTMTGTSRLVRALSKDPATVSIAIPGPYGMNRFIRTVVSTNQTITVAPDGTVTVIAR